MSASDVVTLRGGLTLPVDAIRLALDLENRGLTLTVDEGDVLVVGPRERLTDDDRALIRHWKRHLVAIVRYDAAAHQGGPQ
jgi:hypothetical protein